MIPLSVQDTKDHDAVAFDEVEKFVGETAGEQATEAAIVKGGGAPGVPPSNEPRDGFPPAIHRPNPSAGIHTTAGLPARPPPRWAG